MNSERDTGGLLRAGCRPQHFLLAGLKGLVRSSAHGDLADVASLNAGVADPHGDFFDHDVRQLFNALVGHLCRMGGLHIPAGRGHNVKAGSPGDFL